ncbi:rhomboid-like protein [Streptomyces stelliscabiei]|uniref:rhomboid-like protein n=1 Tax=Streptomyces stelliscabiei TaxID=146820 RepID=UPI00062C09F4|nr:rhomboid-like protein [Streptomyces stelliscabiei]
MDATEAVKPVKPVEFLKSAEPLEPLEPLEPVRPVRSVGPDETVATGAGVARAGVPQSVNGPALDGIPRQPGAAAARARVPERDAEPTGRQEPAPTPLPRSRLPRPWRLLPTPVATPFTFFYASVLVVTSIVAEHAGPALVHALHQGSSTDVAHLVRAPALVLFASALWVAGGVASVYAVGFLLVLTALERRIGGWRTAGVFLLGHVLATLATELPVGLAVLAGRLPGSSLHRLDYGISFGVAASAGALAGLLSPWLRWPMLLLFGGMLLNDLLAFTDPMTNWGHLLALAIGVATWPVVRRWGRAADRGDRGRRGLPEADAGRSGATTVGGA